MAPTPKSHIISTLTGSSKANQTHVHPHSKTPNSKHRLNFNQTKTPQNPKETPPIDHPVEVIGRIRDHPDQKEKPIAALVISSQTHSVRVRTDIGYRDFTLDGVSLSEDEDLDVFYKKFVKSRINGVKLGDKCTVMMYGPTGSGKSHTMFGSVKQQGIVYKALRDILGGSGGGDEENDDEKIGFGTFVQVTVLEIYNEEIYDLLSTNGGGGGGGGGFSLGWSKNNASKVRLEVMGKKAKNATFISGNEAGKISKEIQKVEKRRIVKSTLCNERSSRSHCMIILDVPTVGGRLMLVDMAGSENIEQAGQTGMEAKMQTAKINQGNIALKRVVESIANGDSHVPFRDSKLTMLLQDSFDDDKSKILMILCASPDPKDMHKTISTLEYGAKAKCIIRGPHTPIKEKLAEDSSSAVILGSRIAAMDEFIYKLQMENKQRERERNEAQKELMKKEEEITALRSKLAVVGEKKVGINEEEINMKVNERTQMLKSELDKKMKECQKMAEALVEMERRKMEERILQQQEELELLRQRLKAFESQLENTRDKSRSSTDADGSSFAKKLLSMYTDEDSGMEKSMDLDKSVDLDMGKRDGGLQKTDNSCIQAILGYPHAKYSSEEDDQESHALNFSKKSFLSTVYEEEEEEDDKENPVDDEVKKEVIEEKIVRSVRTPLSVRDLVKEENHGESVMPFDGLDKSSRLERIQNIFTLCGNYRELYQHSSTPYPTKKNGVNSPSSSPVKKAANAPAVNLFSEDLVASGKKQNATEKITEENFLDFKENCNPLVTPL